MVHFSEKRCFVFFFYMLQANIALSFTAYLFKISKKTSFETQHSEKTMI